jgi:hypothetical protein
MNNINFTKMIPDNINKNVKAHTEGLNNEVQQNRGMDQEREPCGDSNEAIGKPVDNGGDVTSEYDIHLEKQWLAVRDDYLANFPELKDMDTRYDKNSFDTLIAKLSKRRKQTEEQTHKEIMDWPSSK